MTMPGCHNMIMAHGMTMPCAMIPHLATTLGVQAVLLHHYTVPALDRSWLGRTYFMP